MRKSLTLKILEILSDSIMTATDIVAAILESGYGSSYSKMDKNYRRFESQRVDRVNIRRERQRFYNLISKLKREGLIEGRGLLRISGSGKEKILKSNKIDLKIGRYKKEKDDTVKIIIFDIPEKDRYKRDWLRASLAKLGFRMLQKSVWMGKVKIPEEFLEDLRLVKINDFVHIFSAEKLGTIELGE